GLDRLLAGQPVPEAVHFHGIEPARVVSQEVGRLEVLGIEPAGALPGPVGKTGEADMDGGHGSVRQTGTPQRRLAMVPMRKVTPTAAETITALVRIRCLTSMPDRKARIVDTRMMTLPPASTEKTALWAPNSTGSTGTVAPRK